MKEFLQVLRRFVPPYKKYLVWSIIFNILSAVLNIFSFMTLIPILQILFKTSDVKPVTKLITWDNVHSLENFVDLLVNNANYYIQHYIFTLGPANTLLIIGLLTFSLQPQSFLFAQELCATSATNSTRKSMHCRSVSLAKSAKVTSLPA